MTTQRSSAPVRARLISAGVCIALVLVAGRELRHHGRAWLQSVRELYHEARDGAKRPTPPAGPIERADEPLIIYADGLANGWQDWSWATHELLSTSQERDGKHTIRMTPDAYKGVYLHHDALDLTGYGTLELWLYSDSPVHGTLGIAVAPPNSNSFGPQVPLAAVTKGWNHITIPLPTLGVSLKSGSVIGGFAIQDTTGKPQPDIYIDGITLLPDMSLPTAPTSATIPVAVDAGAERHPISTLIYGTAHLPKEMAKNWHIGANRWGGNGNSRFNWKVNADNAARDWEFRNVGKENIGKPPGAVVDDFVAGNTAAAVPTVLTIPTIGWVSKDADSEHRSLDVPQQGGPAITDMDRGAIAGYDPAANRDRTSVRSVARIKGAHPGDVAQEEWIRHLVATHGDATHGGVAIYAMDNEPDLWSQTHTDIHPAEMGYDDVLSTFLNYAPMIKEVDPKAMVTGPVSWGWTGYKYSALDRGTDNFHTHADRTAHGDVDFLPWFLKQVHDHDQKSGQRSLDILDVHYYPQGQGIYSPEADTATRERRLRSTRSLWDPTYSDESWIGEPVQLVPRLRGWIADNYPGTKIGITEWNFGAPDDITGGLAIADALGIYGRESVYLADYWTYPKQDSPGYLAFELYRNADGAGNGFGDVSCHAESSDSNRLSSFAAVDSATGDLTVILVNKLRKATVTTPISLHGAQGLGHPVLYRLLPDKTALVREEGNSVHGDTYTVTLPPYSALLIRFSKEKTR